MKAVLISIRVEHNVNIFYNHNKRWEGRKTLPSIVKVKNYIDPTTTYNKSDDDVKFYVYEPKSGGGCGKVIGEFICDFAQSFSRGIMKEIVEALVVSKEFARSYFNKGKGYMIRINEPKRYDQPKELGEFSLFEKKDCDYFWCGICCERTQNNVINCNNLTCEQKIIKRPPQSWCYVEEVEQ